MVKLIKPAFDKFPKVFKEIKEEKKKEVKKEVEIYTIKEASKLVEVKKNILAYLIKKLKLGKKVGKKYLIFDTDLEKIKRLVLEVKNDLEERRRRLKLRWGYFVNKKKSQCL